MLYFCLMLKLFFLILCLNFVTVAKSQNLNQRTYNAKNISNEPIVDGKEVFLDILATDKVNDLGLIKGICNCYNMKYPITKDHAIKISEKWKPYRSVATWYFWRSLDPIPVEY